MTIDYSFPKLVYLFYYDLLIINVDSRKVLIVGLITEVLLAQLVIANSRIQNGDMEWIRKTYFEPLLGAFVKKFKSLTAEGAFPEVN